jgi:hypothetical protein
MGNIQIEECPIKLKFFLVTNSVIAVKNNSTVKPNIPQNIS